LVRRTLSTPIGYVYVYEYTPPLFVCNIGSNYEYEYMEGTVRYGITKEGFDVERKVNMILYTVTLH
jgi:hypothetical protein